MKSKTYYFNAEDKPVKFDGFSGGVSIKWPKPKYITRYKNVIWNKKGELVKKLLK